MAANDPAKAGRLWAEEQPMPTKPAKPRAMRRPVILSALAGLVILVAGGAGAGWRYTQSHYYVGEDAGHVAIYHGINQNLAGLNLSSVYQRTEIPLAAVPATDQSMIRSTIPASSLGHAQSVVGTIRGDYQVCQTATQALTAYNARMRTYTTALNAYKKKHGTGAPVKAIGGKVVAVPPPKPAGTKPTIPADCPRRPRSSCRFLRSRPSPRIRTTPPGQLARPVPAIAKPCVAAGVDETLMEHWIKVGRQRAAVAATTPVRGPTAPGSFACPRDYGQPREGRGAVLIADPVFSPSPRATIASGTNRPRFSLTLGAHSQEH